MGQPIGELAWGGPLNSELAADEAAISQVQNGLANHEANVPHDPHGDQAFAENLVAPILDGVNNNTGPLATIYSTPSGANPAGFVQLVDGLVPWKLLPGGSGLTNFVDVVKDYEAKGDGSTDDSGAINSALAFIAGQGGGVVFLPGGYNFAIGSTLNIGANTWLMVSPDAFITRIAPISAPIAMLANYGGAIGTTPATGNIMVTGGVWNFNHVSGSGTVFSFANCKGLTIQNTNVEGRPDGASPVGKFFGCSFVLLDNIVTTAGAPTVTRGSIAAHVFEFRVLTTGNLSGLGGGVYANQVNSNVQVRNCPLNALTTTSGGYTWSGWYSMCGNWSSSEVSGCVHLYFIIINCSATCLSFCGISFYNVNFVTHKGCAYNYPPAPYFQGWVGSAPGSICWDTEGNAPEKFVAVITEYPLNVITEQIIVQHSIPAYDWLAGSTCYSWDGTGHCGFGTISGLSATFRMYIGVLGTTSDVKVGQFTVYFNNTAASGCSNTPWHLHCHHMSIDSSGNWWPGEFSLECSVLDLTTGSGGLTNSFTGCSNNFCTPVQGEVVFITVTVQFNVAHTTNVWQPHNHICRREHT